MSDHGLVFPGCPCDSRLFHSTPYSKSSNATLKKHCKWLRYGSGVVVIANKRACIT